MNNHPHDAKWIQGQLSMLPLLLREKIELAYSERFSDVASEDTIDARSRARRECNTRLRLAVDKVLES